LLQKEGNLKGVVEELVHLGNLGRDAEVDCPVANLDDEATNDIGVDLAGVSTCAKGAGEEYTYGVLDLELLASTDVARLGDGGLEAVEGLVVQRLSGFPQLVSIAFLLPHDLLLIHLPVGAIPARW
jgi:hypothetical protein